MQRVRTLASVVGMAGLLAVCGRAAGQNALGDGRALDANLHATQGKVNPKAGGISQQLRFNNAVIYGTAPDGKSFRGSVGYRAPNQFEGSVGSDSLYNFRRDSFTSGLAGAGVRGSDALRYQLSLTTGQTVPGFLANAPVGVQREGTVATVSNSTSTNVLRSTSEFLTVQASRPTLVGMRQDEWGAQYVAKASPLLGVSWVKTAESPLGTAAAQANQTPQPAPQPGVVPQPGTGAKPVSPRATPAGLSGLEAPAPGIGNLLDSARLDTRTGAIPTRAASEMHEQLLTRFRDNFGAPSKSTEVGAKPAPETKSFEEQLEILHRRMRGQSDTPEEKKQPLLAPDGSMRPKKPAKPDKPIGDPKGIEQPKEAELSPEMVKALKKSSETKLEKLIADAPRPGNEHGDPAGYRVLMREGEELIAKGRFFDAEERFTRAMAAQPRDPLSRIGRVHAEIGAGLYLSAAANLRAVFADYPEMVGTKYAESLLPAEPRATRIVEQLADKERRAESLLGRESALLLAYMGYQRGDEKSLTQGLTDLDNRIPQGEAGMEDRALLAVLKAAWTK